jgi:predicted TIM-barrel fold metal-dependent hydrolase
MWSTDYPHPASFFPHSQEILRHDFIDVPAADKRKIVYDNAAQLYGFDISKQTTFTTATDENPG